MKTYWIKKMYANKLKNLHGLIIAPSERGYYVNINVFDYQTMRNFDANHSLVCLPKNCDNTLIHAALGQIQLDKAAFEQVERLKEYLNLAKEKDKNDLIRSNLKQSLNQIFLGFFIVLLAGIAGASLIFLITILSPVSAGWIALLTLPIAGTVALGLLKLSLGCFKLGIGIFSIFFRKKNIEQLPQLENQLRSCYVQALSSPPSYYEVMENHKEFPSMPDLHTEPPTYQEVIESNASFFASSDREIKDNVLSISGQHFRRN